MLQIHNKIMIQKLMIVLVVTFTISTATPNASYFIQDCSLHDDFCLYTNGSTASNVDDGENICSIDGGILLNLFIDKNLYLNDSTRIFIRSYKETRNKSVLFRNESYGYNGPMNCSYYEDQSRRWKVDVCSNETQFLVVCLKKKCNIEWEMISDKLSRRCVKLVYLSLDKCKLFCELEVSSCNAINWDEYGNRCESCRERFDTYLMHEPGMNYYQMLTKRKLCHNFTNIYNVNEMITSSIDQQNSLSKSMVQPNCQNKCDALIVGMVLGSFTIILIIIINILVYKYYKLKKSLSSKIKDMKPPRTNKHVNKSNDQVDGDEPHNYEMLHL